MLRELVPGEPEAAALLALMLLHDSRREPIDWPSVAALYGTLGDLTGSAVVELNRAVAVAEVDGPQAALAVVDALDLDGYRYFHSTRAELLRRIGDDTRAAAAYRAALALTTTEAERRFLERRLAELRLEYR
jgi:RNA polymerase sigma-70 factor (ECF subfamily)